MVYISASEEFALRSTHVWKYIMQLTLCTMFCVFVPPFVVTFARASTDNYFQHHIHECFEIVHQIAHVYLIPIKVRPRPHQWDSFVSKKRVTYYISENHAWSRRRVCVHVLVCACVPVSCRIRHATKTRCVVRFGGRPLYSTFRY